MIYKQPSIKQLYIIAGQFLMDEATLNTWQQDEADYAYKLITDFIEQIVITQRGGLE